MPDIILKNIKKLETKIDLVYCGYRIYVETDDYLITIRVESDIEKIEVLKIIRDKGYNDCMVEFINIMLKPFIDIAIGDVKKIENKL